MQKRQYGDEMMERVIHDLQFHGVNVTATKASGSVDNNCDALMPKGGLAFEGKASAVKKSLTGDRKDLKKAEEQAQQHHRHACLVVENKRREMAIFLPEKSARAMGLSKFIDDYDPIELNTKNWTLPPEWAIAVLKNKYDEIVLAGLWDELLPEMLPTLKQLSKG